MKERQVTANQKAIIDAFLALKTGEKLEITKNGRDDYFIRPIGSFHFKPTKEVEEITFITAEYKL